MADRPTTPSRLVPILAFAVIATGLITGGVAVWLGVSGDETAEAMARKLEREAASWEAHKRSRRAEGED